MSIFSRFFRRGRSSKTASATSNKADFDDPPPPSLEKTSKHKLPDAEENLVYRLQCFITRLLRVRYDIQGEIWDIDKDTTYYDHYFDLCKKYCMLLGMQFSTSQEVLATKQELLRVIFEPAKTLGIPADVMEWFLFFTRKAPNKLPPKHEFEVARIAPYPLGMLLCLVVDYTVMIDAAVEPHYPGLVPRLKDRCLVLHQLYFPWMLDPRLIKLDQMVGTLQNYRHLGCPVESRHKGPNKIRKHHSSSSSAVRGKDACSPDPCSQCPDLHISCYLFSSDFPSVLLPYRLHISWPIVSFLLCQGRRPCIALAAPSSSQSLYVSYTDLATWTQAVRKDPKTKFQPQCKKTARETFSCGLPNSIRIGNLRFDNPEGGAPKSVVGEEGEGWEEEYVREHLGMSRHDETSRRGLLVRPIEQQHEEYSGCVEDL